MPEFLYFRFDVSGLTDDEIAGLTGEVSVQAEVSDLHPPVEAPAPFDHSQLVETISDALERAHDGAELRLGDDDQGLYLAEVAAAISGIGRSPRRRTPSQTARELTLLSKSLDLISRDLIEGVEEAGDRWDSALAVEIRDRIENARSLLGRLSDEAIP